MKIMRRVVAVALRLLSVALLLGAVAFGGYLIVDLASVIGLGDINWEGAVMLFLFFSVVPALGAIAVWKAASHVRGGGQGSNQ
jgi:hypothetical protein